MNGCRKGTWPGSSAEVIENLDLITMSNALSRHRFGVLPPGAAVGPSGFYGYATGVFCSRKLERATYETVAYRNIAANDHPDHDTIATFRRRSSC